MDQKFEGTPKAEIRLSGQKVTRNEVTHDWGSRLQWEVRRDDKIIATPTARLAADYQHDDKTPGKYQVVLQMWKYEGYKSGCQGKYIDISNKVTYTL